MSFPCLSTLILPILLAPYYESNLFSFNPIPLPTCYFMFSIRSNLVFTRLRSKQANERRREGKLGFYENTGTSNLDQCRTLFRTLDGCQTDEDWLTWETGRGEVRLCNECDSLGQALIKFSGFTFRRKIWMHIYITILILSKLVFGYMQPCGVCLCRRFVVHCLSRANLASGHLLRPLKMPPAMEVETQSNDKHHTTYTSSIVTSVVTVSNYQ